MICLMSRLIKGFKSTERSYWKKRPDKLKDFTVCVYMCRPQVVFVEGLAKSEFSQNNEFFEMWCHKFFNSTFLCELVICG